ncbi:hypothetical protein ACOJUR_12180 [Alicyclobacillus tolerans]|uniref:hypothetical protein n=1 Tax=Alicyclobacillus tolerans TaxID=90970 RepID=UPI003B7CFF2D
MKIQEIKRYRFECSEEEVKSIVMMLQFYEVNADEDDSISAAVRRQFGVQQSPMGKTEIEEEQREGTLVEKALSQAQGKRKGRIRADQ